MCTTCSRTAFDTAWFHPVSMRKMSNRLPLVLGKSVPPPDLRLGRVVEGSMGGGASLMAVSFVFRAWLSCSEAQIGRDRVDDPDGVLTVRLGCECLGGQREFRVHLESVVAEPDDKGKPLRPDRELRLFRVPEQLGRHGDLMPTSRVLVGDRRPSRPVDR